MNPARSVIVTSTLPDAGAQRFDVRGHLGRGDHRLDHLDQRHDRRRVEEVHADDAVRAVGGDGDLGDRQRRGVRDQDRLGRADPVQLSEDRLLEFQVLGHRLDGEIHVVQRLESDRERDPAEQGVAVLGAQLALRHRPIGRVSQRARGRARPRRRRSRPPRHRCRCARTPPRCPRPWCPAPPRRLC